jgi:hypothetical protein
MTLGMTCSAKGVEQYLTELGFVVMRKSIAGGSAQMSAPEGWPHTPKDRLR